MRRYKTIQLENGITWYKQENQMKLVGFLFFYTIGAILLYIAIMQPHQQQQILSPIPDEPTLRPSIVPTATIKPTATPSAKLKGTASYYSRAGCLGCSETLTMANGETLDDTRLTIALTPETVRQHKLLNDTVEVTNISNGMKILAKVTDTGGFAKYNRVADLGVAVKEAIQCTSLCEVEVNW